MTESRPLRFTTCKWDSFTTITTFLYGCAFTYKVPNIQLEDSGHTSWIYVSLCGPSLWDLEHSLATAAPGGMHDMNVDVLLLMSGTVWPRR
ncbi:hypothetical protein Pcinc_027816 [Petrolisthes cinctipes]|uniref:Uncharacterized protein n=1 Tax=Petrolisthes cinctipes TaxID=88211 RepID=A0AAE1K9S4_PETCI|nr:hypothetical protein Pcinc_027816 [Petrolisthes cinctipes]